MNDKEFREKCREIICQQLNELDEFFKSNKGYGFDPEVAKSVALLYIAANMPNLNDEKKKP